MPAILIRILLWLMTSFAGQVLFSLGLGTISFAGFSTIISWFTGAITPYITGMPQSVVYFAKAAEVDYGVSIILSALIIRSTIMSAQVAFQKK